MEQCLHLASFREGSAISRSLTRSSRRLEGVSYNRDRDSFPLVAQRRGAREIVTAVLSRRRLAFEDLAEDSADDDVYVAAMPGVTRDELSEPMAAMADDLAQHGLAVILGLKLLDDADRFVGLTSELVVRFSDEVAPDEVDELSKRHDLTVTRSIEFLGVIRPVRGDVSRGG